MNKFALLACVGALALGGCHSASVGPGQEAVLIEKPMFFGHGGVDETPVKTGRSFVALTTEVVPVDVKPIQREEKFDDLMSADGIPLGFDSTIRLQVTDSVGLIKKFGPGWYETNVASEFRNRVRQAVRKHGMNETAISTTAIDAIDTEITSGMQSYIGSAGLPIRLIKITVGKANPPDSIKDQRIKTASEEQRRVTEAQTKIAEDARKAAEQARAEADNAYRTSMNLSPEQFVDLQRINMQRDVCEKGGCTFIVGNASPVINAK